MYTHKKPVWRSLTILGLLGGLGLVLETQLPAGAQAHMLLQLFWVVLFHAGLFVWLRRNGVALEAEPPALDAAGRPIIDNGAPLFAAPAGDERPLPAPQALNQSEAY
jgi:hypothetical protein